MQTSALTLTWQQCARVQLTSLNIRRPSNWSWKTHIWFEVWQSGDRSHLHFTQMIQSIRKKGKDLRCIRINSITIWFDFDDVDVQVYVSSENRPMNEDQGEKLADYYGTVPLGAYVEFINYDFMFLGNWVTIVDQSKKPILLSEIRVYGSKWKYFLLLRCDRDSISRRKYHLRWRKYAIPHICHIHHMRCRCQNFRPGVRNETSNGTKRQMTRNGEWHESSNDTNVEWHERRMTRNVEWHETSNDTKRRMTRNVEWHGSPIVNRYAMSTTLFTSEQRWGWGTHANGWNPKVSQTDQRIWIKVIKFYVFINLKKWKMSKKWKVCFV